MRIIAPTLRLTRDDQEQLLPRARLTRYGADEYLQYTGQVPKRMMFIVNGRVRLAATDDAGGLIPVRTLESGDFLGQTALTLEPVAAAAYALDEVTVLAARSRGRRGTGDAKAGVVAGLRPRHRRATGKPAAGVGRGQGLSWFVMKCRLPRPRELAPLL